MALVYLDLTFPQVPDLPPAFRPRFRLVDSAVYWTQLRSDRSHMRKGETWLQPPPGWPSPSEFHGQSGSNLDAFVDTQSPFFGELMDLDELRRRLTF